MYNLWCFIALNGSKISFVAIYAVLSRIFCRDLPAFVWRKIMSKIVCVEKKDKYQVWRSHVTHTHVTISSPGILKLVQGS